MIAFVMTWVPSVRETRAPKVIVPNNPVAYRDDGERPVGVVAEGGDEAVVHPELVAVGTDMVKKLGPRLRRLALVAPTRDHAT